MNFFFYGTLLDGSDNAVAQAVHALLAPLGSATVHGRMVAVPDPDGWFPALLPGDGVVHGKVFAARPDFVAADLARLDAYEDYDSALPATSLYLRGETVAVMANGAEIVAQAYWYNQPLSPHAVEIVGGDFRAWLRASGAAAFTGLRRDADLA